MTPFAWFWAAVGALAGIMHVRSLWRATRSLLAPPSAILRLPLMGATLLAAAWMGGLIPAAVGWAVGFSISLAVFAVGRKT